MNYIQLKDVSKYWGTTKAVENLNIEIKKGEFVIFLGPSGCGKSTTLRLIAGLEEVSSGQIEIDGRNVNNTDPANRNVSMVFQSYALFPHLNVAENIIFGLKVRKVEKNERNARLVKVAEIVGLEDLLKRKPSELSGGQRQRVALARAIISDNPICLMDEPLSNLDAGLRVHMRAEISELHRDLKTTFIYVTHDQAEALTMSDRMAVMMDGEILQLDTPHEIYNNPSTIRVAEFVGSPKINILNGEYDEKGNLNCFGTKITDSIKLAQKGNVSVGIRPEHMELVSSKDKNVFKGKIVYRENLGSDIFFHLTVNEGEQKMIVRSEPSKVINTSVGDQVMIGWDEQKVMVFDVDGKNITMQ